MAIDLNYTLGSLVAAGSTPLERQLLNEMFCLQLCDKDEEDEARLKAVIAELGELGVLQRALDILEEGLLDIPRARRDA